MEKLFLKLPKEEKSNISCVIESGKYKLFLYENRLNCLEHEALEHFHVLDCTV